jgi:hypothetical protein
MLISSPNSVGIDPVIANEDVFKASGRLVLSNHATYEQTGRTGQLVAVEMKFMDVDELAELGGDRPYQRK